MQDGMSRGTVVVPVQTLADVACDSGVMMRGFRVTADDVDEAFFDAVHAKSNRHASSHRFLEEFLRTHFDCTRFEQS